MTAISSSIPSSWSGALDDLPNTWRGLSGQPHRRRSRNGRPVWPTQFAGTYLGFGRSNPVFSGAEHATLVIGPPRSGKTTSVIIPALTYWAGPAVVTSTKSDVLSVTGAHRSSRGTVWSWDPSGTTRPPPRSVALRWSPVPGCERWDTAVARSHALVTAARPGPLGDGAHWVERAQALLAPLLHAAAVIDADLSAVTDWLHRRDAEHPLAALDGPESSIAHQLLTGIMATDPRERSGIWSTADGLLSAYRTHATLAAAKQPNFDPGRFATSTDTLFICAPAETQAQHAPLICALFDQLRRACSARSSPWPPVLWALDEVANIAPLPSLPSIVADAGAQGLVVLACLQDLSQARQRWGGAADGFLTLFPNTVVLPGVADPATLKTLSMLGGQVDRSQTTVTRGRRANSRSTSSRKEPLLAEADIARGRRGESLLIRGASPHRMALTPWYSTPTIRSILERSAR